MPSVQSVISNWPPKNDRLQLLMLILLGEDLHAIPPFPRFINHVHHTALSATCSSLEAITLVIQDENIEVAEVVVA